MATAWQMNLFDYGDKETPVELNHNKTVSERTCHYAYHTTIYTKSQDSCPHGEKATVNRSKDPTYWKRGNCEKETLVEIHHSKTFSDGACHYAYQAKYTTFHNSCSHGENTTAKRPNELTYWRRENRDKEDPVAIHDTKPFSEGTCRYAYHAKYSKFHKSRSEGERAIVKKLKDFTIWKRDDWNEETRLATKAKEFVENWNATHSVEKQYIIHVPEVIRCNTTGGDFKDGEWITLEPYIQRYYEKWNSNSGWSKEHKLSVHAFCHWTYHYSGGTMLLCDAQGVRNGDSYSLTDPAICSMKKGQYGMTDI